MIARTRWGWDSFVTLPAIGGLVLGAVSLGGGFYGQVGVTAVPLGVAVGVAVGAVAAFVGFRVPAFVLALLMSGAFLTAATQYWKLPEDRWQGSIIEAEVRACDLPGSLVPAGVATWEQSSIDTAGWRTPRPGWRDEVPGMLRDDPGVVLTLSVHRTRDVYRQAKPWNRGQLRATRWSSINEDQRYFARFAGAGCDGYPIGQRRLFAPEWEASSVSPPDILPPLLGLSVLEDVPPNFQAFIQP